MVSGRQLLHHFRRQAEKYPFIGRGTSREVYDVGEGLCMKCAIDGWGVEQNRKEVALFGKMDELGYGDNVARIEGYDEGWEWVACEYVKGEKVNIRKHLGLSRWRFFLLVLSNFSMFDLLKDSSYRVDCNGKIKLVDGGNGGRLSDEKVNSYVELMRF